MDWLLAGVLLSTALVACEKDDPTRQELLRLCTVEWRGTLLTDSSAFDVQACWNGRCSDNIPVQVVQNDDGSALAFSDAGCVPTTTGGLPSHCELVPVTPRPGCGVGEIGKDFSVSACAQSGRDGTTFIIGLTAATEGFPDDGDRFGLTIETTNGTELVGATGTLGSSGTAAGSRSCRGGLFGLDGKLIE